MNNTLKALLYSPNMEVVLLILHLILHFTNGQNIHLPDSKSFHMTERSPPQWKKVGENAILTCKTSEPWDFCRWVLPNGDFCDKRPGELYDVSCDKNPRVKFKKVQWHKLMNSGYRHSEKQSLAKNICSIEIIDVQLEDHGAWQCMATPNPFARTQEHAETFIDVHVASGYQVAMLERPDQILSLINDSIVEEVICQTKGKSHVKPYMVWTGNGQEISNEHIDISAWEETNSDGEIIMYQSLSIDQKLLNYLNMNTSHDPLLLNLRCSSIQKFPNGETIHESSVHKILQILKVQVEEEDGKQSMNITALVIVILMGVAVLMAIGLLCYAQKQHIWCYKDSQVQLRSRDRSQNQDPPTIIEPGTATSSRIPSPRSNSVAETTELFIEEGGNLPVEAVVGGSSDHRQPQENDSFSSQEGIPPIENTDEDSVNGFLKANDAERLLELISSPPPRIANNEEEDQKAGGFKFEFSRSSSASLSEGLTVPSRQIKRRINEYVKVRPQSREVLDSVDNDSIQEVPSGQGMTTSAVIEHHETAL